MGSIHEFLEEELKKYKGVGSLMPNYGWVQNTSNLSTIRETVELFDSDEISHNEYMRKILQYRVTCDNLGKKRKWSWDARCRIKAVCACGMVRLNREINGYTLTDLGKELIMAPKSEKLFKGKRVLTEAEIEIFRKGLLTNPPVIRVLSLLNEDRRNGGKGLSKYDIGGKLGFVGDVGFTHLEPEFVARSGKQFNDAEGDADKWGRTIISWLCQVAWAEQTGRLYYGEKPLPIYSTKYEVDQVLRYKAKSTKKYVPSEMLCSDHHPFPKLIQNRRCKIIDILSRSQTIDIDELTQKLIKVGLDIDRQTLEFDIINLQQAGIQVHKERNTYNLTDKIELDVKEVNVERSAADKIDSLEKKIEAKVTQYADTLPARLVDNLIRYGHDGTNSAALFEATIEKFFMYLGYETEYLGQGHGRVADVIVKYKDAAYPKSYAIVIDAKAYDNKYSFPAGDVRKMKEYINFHGPTLLQENIPNHAFAFVSPQFSNEEVRLKEIADDTMINGTAIETDNLLELGNKIKKQDYKISEIYSKFTTNVLFVV